MAFTSLTIIDNKSSLFTVRVALEQRFGVAVHHAQNTTAGLDLLHTSPSDCILVNPSGIEAEVTEFLTHLARMGKNTPVIVAGDEKMTHDLRSAYSYVVGYIPSVYNENDLLPFLQRQPLKRPATWQNRALAERSVLIQTNRLLEQRVQEVMALHQIGKAVASLTDLDTILTHIVEAAVYLLHAQESSIMLTDPETNELFLRAQKGVGEKYAQGFDIKVEDSLIGSVVRSRRPVRLARGGSADAQLKVVTGYMVNALLYVPLTLRGQVKGVLGVANQTANKAFDRHDQRLMEILADYAALAIEIARQHNILKGWHEDTSLIQTIATTVKELRERLATDDPDILDAVRRIEGAVDTLTQIADTGTPQDV